jgi:DNA repair protein RecN (Recombination protein N)
VLVELRISNFAVFAEASLSPAPRLTVLTGETGAGKSLLVGAVLLLLGERGGSDRVRAGADRATVEGVFELAGDEWIEWLDARGITHALPDDRLLILKREIAATGRSRAWINGGPVATMLLAEVGQRLVSVLGQHESHALGDADTQRVALDAFADASAVAESVRAAFLAHGAAVARRSALEAQRVDAMRRADYLRFVVQEIAGARLVDGEVDRLDEEVRRLSNAEELRTLSIGAADRLDGGDDGGVIAQLAALRRQLHQLSRIDPATEALEELLDQAEAPLAELSRELASYAEGIDLDPSRLRTVEQRRDVVQSVLRKHGPTITDALSVLADAETALALVDDAAGGITDADRAVAAAMSTWQRDAETLSTQRRQAAAVLAKEVSALLPSLGMPDGRLEVRLTSLDGLHAHGAERVEWMVGLNAGDELRPLGRVSSGGELARLMLAVTTVLARVQAVPTLIFDEIDAGIGGAVAVQVGAAMRQLATHHQVLAVTHLAQIAACAEVHGAVGKVTRAGQTAAHLQLVEGDTRISELARMLGGDADREVARAHARELFLQAQQPPTAAKRARQRRA